MKKIILIIVALFIPEMIWAVSPERLPVSYILSKYFEQGERERYDHSYVVEVVSFDPSNSSKSQYKTYVAISADSDELEILSFKGEVESNSRENSLEGYKLIKRQKSSLRKGRLDLIKRYLFTLNTEYMKVNLEGMLYNCLKFSSPGLGGVRIERNDAPRLYRLFEDIITIEDLSDEHSKLTELILNFNRELSWDSIPLEKQSKGLEEKDEV